MDDIPFEEQRVIDELVELWRTGCEPRALLSHIRSTWKPGEGKVTWFFAQVYQDLLAGKPSKYLAFSASEFKQCLEDEYRRLAQASTSHQAQVKAEEHEEYEKRARANFDVLSKKMVNTTNRLERIGSERKRIALTPYNGFSYENHCWKCKEHISSDTNAKCLSCERYICISCGSCLCGSPTY